MGEIKHSKITDLEVSRKCDHEGYEYYRRQGGAGELLFFPVGAVGAHKRTSCSDTENLVYIDFDVIHDLPESRSTPIRARWASGEWE